jgi:hypothetical protein
MDELKPGIKQKEKEEKKKKIVKRDLPGRSPALV